MADKDEEKYKGMSDAERLTAMEKEVADLINGDTDDDLDDDLGSDDLGDDDDDLGDGGGVGGDDDLGDGDDDLSDDELDEQELEDEAKRQGHCSKEEWVKQGKNPKHWRTAEEYLAVGEQIKTTSKKEYAKLAADNEKLQKSIDILVKGQMTARDEGRKEALEELKAKKREAVSDRDNDLVDEIDEEIDKLKVDEIDDDDDDEVVDDDKPQITEAVQDFIDDNKWFREDDEMRARAVQLDKANRKRGMRDDKSLARVLRTIKREYPEEFEGDPPENKNRNRNKNRDRGDLAEGGSFNGREQGKRNSKRNVKKSFGDLPNWAKPVAKQVINKTPGMTEEKYVVSFFKQQAK